jgi:methyl coenzyme M reductase beta subunit
VVMAASDQSRRINLWKTVSARPPTAAVLLRCGEHGCQSACSVTVNNVLLYATGGGGWMHGKVALAALGVSFSGDAWHSGWSAGGGAEWAFLPNWSAKVE